MDEIVVEFFKFGSMCCGLIDVYGTEEQRQKYLPALTSMQVPNFEFEVG